MAEHPDELDALLQVFHSRFESLKETSRQHRQLIDHAVDVICMVDATGNFRWLSPAVRSVWGYEQEQLVGKPVSEFIAPEDLASDPLQGILGAEKSMDNVSVESRFRRADGNWIHLSWSVHWSANDNGLFCVTRDITSRVLAENKLRESEERTRLIIESLPVSVVFVNAKGYIEMFNPKAESVLEYKHAELAGLHLSCILPEQDRGQRSWSDQLADRSSITVSTKSGAKFPAELSFQELSVDRKKKYILVLQDVSERFAVEMLKRQFVAMITHDIRTPLQSVLTLLELFADGIWNPNLPELAARAVTQVARLSALTQDLMDFETSEQGKFSLHRSDVSIKTVIEDAYHALSRLAGAQNVSIVLPDNDVTCYADHSRLVQVVVNLLSNAVKYSPPGEKVIVCLTQEQNQVKVVVKDLGRGVATDKLKDIFDPYKQATKADIRIGTGLGLAICKMIVEQHGGTIGVECPANGGSAFWFVIPLAS